jgi:hypothetical protein
MVEWTEWRPFPDPRQCEYLYAPFGPGVYELRNHRTGQHVLFGRGENVAYRMSSLLPSPLGHGTRNNADKRQYVLQHLPDIEYRTMACASRQETLEFEAALKYSQRFIFRT